VRRVLFYPDKEVDPGETEPGQMPRRGEVLRVGEIRRQIASDGGAGASGAPEREHDGSEPASSVDRHFIGEAIDLAWLAAGKTQPNPLVGAVVVKGGEVLGAGYHARYGEEHAETIALARAGDAARGSTLYVTLEPCAHHGNTPPCVDQIIASGVSRVVVPTLDPDPRVNGGGIRALRENGIRADVGVGAERALLLNLPYFKSKLGLGPAVTLKIAVTLDGKIASTPGRRDDITEEKSQRMAHRLRAIHDAVLVGIETVVVDTPRLDCRLLDGIKPPSPVVIDPDLRFPANHPWLGGREVFVVTLPGAPEDRMRALAKKGARVIRCAASGRRFDIAAAVDELYRAGVKSVLVEGGARVFSSFAASGAWDAMFVFVSPILFGPGGVGLSDRALERAGLGAVFAGATHAEGDVLLGYVSEKSRAELLSRLC
jgi:diaminohydroxyphosphoribosylaminopyrimidine deaminase/5-amino-6-(5-phosphoribosylamino)uracil reductase